MITNSNIDASTEKWELINLKTQDSLKLLNIKFVLINRKLKKATTNTKKSLLFLVLSGKGI